MSRKINVIDTEIKYQKIGYIILLENLGEELEDVLTAKINHQIELGAKQIRLSDKSNNIDKTKLQNYIGDYEFNWYTDFYLMKLPCKKAENLNSELELRDLEKEKIEDFIKIYDESFGKVINAATYEYKSVLEMFENEKIKLGFIKYNGKTIGFYELGLEDGEDAELSAIGVIPEYRGKSLGRRSIEIINNIVYEKGYKNIKLLVASINNNAFELYKDMGFEILGDKYSCWYEYKI